MPKQSRGFWICDFCGITFDRFEEARYHEVEECTRSTAYSHSSLPSHAPSVAEATPAAAAMAPYEAERFPHTMFEYGYGAQKFRFPLLGLEESHLAEADAVACRNLELFEMNELATPTERGYPRRGQVGLRCLLCANATELTTKGAEYSLPRAVNSLGDAVRRLADHHLSVCTKVQPHDRWILEHAARTRKTNKEEGKSSWNEDDNNRRALITYCSDRCQRLGIVDKYPENSGIELRDDRSPFDSDVFDASPMTTPQQVSAMGSSIPKGPPQAPDTAGQYALRVPPARHVEYSSTYQSPDALDPRIAPPMGMTLATGPSPVPPMGHSPPPHPAYYRGSHYDVPVSFPFFQDPNEGTWICKFCSHIHPQYRDLHYRWSSADNLPPPGDFIDHHLSVCRAYHQANHSQLMTPPPPRTPIYGFSPAGSHHYGPGPLHWDIASVSRSPDVLAGMPPSGRSESPITSRSYVNPSLEQYHHRGSEQVNVAGIPDSGRLEANALHAIEYLIANDKSSYLADGTVVPQEEQLVHEDDKILLTDFLFYLMKQLRLVRFSEADRKTRGGKRERIKVGYGGLECVHCAHIKKSRKFFWSGVDRLANSFAEIPTHVFKCKYCPQPFKDALTQLKQIHSEQMARLPRGSQKVFFRRVWKRIHQDDPEPPSPEDLKPPPEQGALESSNKPGSPFDTKQGSPSGGTSGSDESILFLDRPTKEAAKALADSAMQAGPPSPSSRVLLAITEDRDFLSDTDCFIRRQLEVFCATKDDVRVANDDRKFPVQEGQVGIRCIHCSLAKSGAGAGGHAVAYPFSISGIFEAVREFQRLHLDYCENLPPTVKSKLASLKESTTITSIQRKYYALAARGLGLSDSKDGICAGSESIHIDSQAVFSFPESTFSTVPEESDDPVQGDESYQLRRPGSQLSDRTLPTGHSRKRSLRQDQESSVKKPATPEHPSSNYPSR